MEATSEEAVRTPEPVQYTPAAPSASVALPWTSAPVHLTGELPGDDGFDPFGFAADGNMNKMREAEIKHSRLAMLAAAGWPISERLDPVLAKILNLPVVLNGKNPKEVATMQRKELKNGRLAMTAIVMFALQEALVGKGVYQTTPGVFEPFWDTFASMSK